MATAAIMAYKWVVSAVAKPLFAAGLSGSTSMAIAKFAVQNTLLLAASTAVNLALAPKIHANGTPTQLDLQPTPPVAVVMGRRGVKGSWIFADEYGDDNRYFTAVAAYSLGPIKGFEAYSYSKKTISFNGAGEATSPAHYVGKMWRQFSRGEQPQAQALSQEGLHNNVKPTGWGAASKASGIAHTMATFYQDSKFKSYPSGLSLDQIQVIEGKLLYDPRQDSSFPGGSGSCRWGAISTYVYSENPGIHALNHYLGHWNNNRLMLGLGVEPEFIDIQAFVELANVCDLNGWKSSVHYTDADDPHEVGRAILQAGGARYIEVGGKISCFIRQPRVPVATLSASDVAGPVRVTSAPASRTLVNTVRPKCVQESHNWETVPIEPVSEPAYIEADGGLNDIETEYPFVPDVTQGAHLAAYDMLDIREPIRGDVPLQPHMRKIKVGSAFLFGEDSHGLSGSIFVCTGRSRNLKTGVTTISFVSESAGKHDYALGRTSTPPTPPSFTTPDIYNVPPPAIDAWGAGPGVGPNPSIVIGGSVDNATAQAVIIEYRPKDKPGGGVWGADEGWIRWGQFDPNTVNVTITGLDPNTVYEIGVRYLSDLGVLGARRIIGEVATGGLAADNVGGLTREQLQESLAFLASANPALAGGLGVREQAGYNNLFADPLFQLGVGSVRSPQGLVDIDDGAPRAVSVTASGGAGDALTLVLGPRFDLRAGARLAAACEVRASGSISDAALKAYFFDAAGAALGAGVTIASGVVDGARAAGFIENVDIPATTNQVELRLEGIFDGTGEGRIGACELLAAYTAPQQSSVPAFVDPKDETVSRALDLLRVDVERAYQLAGLEYETSVSRALITVLQEVTANAARYQIATQYETQGGQTLSLIELLAADGESRILLLSGLLAFANTVSNGDPLVAMEVRNGIVHFLTEARLAEGGAFTHYTGSTLRICLGAHPVSGDVGIFLYDVSGSPLLEFNATDNVAKLYPGMAAEGFASLQTSGSRTDYDLTTASSPRNPADFIDLSVATTGALPLVVNARYEIEVDYTIGAERNAFEWFTFVDQVRIEARTGAGAWVTVQNFGDVDQYFSTSSNTGQVPTNIGTTRTVTKRIQFVNEWLGAGGHDEVRAVLEIRADALGGSSGCLYGSPNDTKITNTLKIEQARIKLIRPTPGPNAIL